MTELWYRNPKVLFSDINEFLPSNNLNRNQKINALARFALYFGLLIFIFKEDTKYISVSVIILITSCFLGTTEHFTSSDNIEKRDICQEPTKENPFMNYTLGDLIDSKDRPKACSYDQAKDDIRKNFRSHLYADSSDIWGKYISDRNFYSLPNTEIVNDQTGFALWCYGKSGECKTTGNNCLKVRDPTYHRGRITTLE